MENKNFCGMDCACNNKNNSCCGSGCGYGCGYGGYGKHRLIRKIFWIIIIIMIFSFGMEIGELKGELKAGYHSYGMMGGYGKSFNYYPNMMWGNQNKLPAIQNGMPEMPAGPKQ